MIMTIQRVDKSQWRPFLDAISKLIEGKVAEVEVASLKLGDQTEAEWLPLLGITYDPRDDVVDIELDGVDHIITKPREIYFDGDVNGLTVLGVVDGDGVRQIVKLKDSLVLPAPRS
jgi:hypothetical protein